MNICWSWDESDKIECLYYIKYSSPSFGSQQARSHSNPTTAWNGSVDDAPLTGRSGALATAMEQFHQS